MKVLITLALVTMIFAGIPRSRSQSSAASSVSSADDRAELVNIERSAWEAEKRKDRVALARLLGDGYFDFGSDGRYDPATVLSTGWMKGDTLEDFSWTDLQVKILDDHTALVTYRGKYLLTGENIGEKNLGKKPAVRHITALCTRSRRGNG